MQSLRYVLRGLRLSPGFTAVAVLTLALGIGGNSAIFSLVDAFLFRRARVPQAERLVSLADRDTKGSAKAISYPNFLDWRQQNRVFETMAAYRVFSLVMRDEAGAERVPAMQVSASLLSVFGARPSSGRDFLPEEDHLGADPVALISHDLWQRRYGGDPAVLGRKVGIANRMFRVVGVLPAGFRVGPRADMMTPIEQWGREGRGSSNSLYAVARLRAGVTIEQARSQMELIAAGLERQYPEANRGRRVEVLPLGKARAPEMRRPLLMLLAAAGFVLWIACTNISNLLLARAVGREREVAIRKALGASRMNLIGQFFTESLVLAAIGGAVGLLFGYWGCQGLLALAGDPDRWPGGEPLGGIGMDARVFLFTLLVTLATAVAVGLVPAIRSTRGPLTGAMKQTTVGASKESRGFRNLMTVEVALAVVLLTGAGLLIRSLHHLLTSDRGFEAAHVLTLSLTRTAGKPFEEDRARLLEEITALPGVEAAAVAFPLPFGHGNSGDRFQCEGQAEAARGGFREAAMHYVSPGYFRTLGIRLQAGRWLLWSDRERAAVVNEQMARECWPGTDPIGRRFRLGTPTPNSPWVTVAGVAANTKENGLEHSTAPEVYLVESRGSDLLVRTAGDPAALAAAIRAQIRGIDRELAVFDVYPLAERISDSVRDQRGLTWMLASFAGTALVLAAVGIYGVVTYAVSRRTHEMGIRVALGAQSRDVVRLVLGQGMTPVVAGLGLGLAGAWGTTQVLQSWLFGLTASDPWTYAAVSLLLVTVALAACYLPARRATRIDPLAALREE